MARRRFLDQSFTVGFKGPQDFLTEVDGETEAFIAERLLQVFPTDGFIGEESKARPAGEGGAAWVVDPIDGTANFARGVPHFCVSIACVAADKVEVGVIYDPMRDELFSGRRGGGARLNGALMRASAASRTRQLRNRGWLEHACGPRPIRRPLASGRLHRRLAVADRLRRARPRLCRGRPARRLRRAPYQCVGLSRRDPAGHRGWRLRERFFARRWSHQGQSARCLRAWGQGCPYRRRGFRGRYDMTEITLTHGDAEATIALLGAEARSWRVAGRDLLWPGDPAIWSDISPILYPVVGWTRDSEERVDGVRYPLGSARLRAFRDFRGRDIRARLRAADAQRQFEHARDLSVRLRARDRISAERRRARNRDRSRQSRRAARALRLRVAPRFPLAARLGGTRGRAGPVRQGGAARGSGTRARRTCPQRRHARSPFAAAICRCPTPCSNTTRYAFSIVRAGRWRLSTPPGLRSRWNMRASSTRRCGRGPTRRSSVSRPGPATAIPTVSPAICSRSPACGCSNRESKRAMKRASSSGRSKA